MGTGSPGEMVRRPDATELDQGASLLSELATAHGLSRLRHGDEPGELVATFGAGRSYFDIVAFEDEVESRVGRRPDVVSDGTPGAKPGRSIGAPAAA